MVGGVNSPELILFPAVDIKGGQAVQLVQGVSDSAKQFGDPIEAAMRWCDQGAEWLHVVDLDGAFGDGRNLGVIESLVKAVPVKVEVSGGIRDDASLEAVLATGAERVNIGTAAVENPEWCASAINRHGEKIAISLDVKDGKLASRGWTEAPGELLETLGQMSQAGCERFVVTDVRSDGMLGGPNLELLGQVCAHTDAHVVASGGVHSLSDILKLRGLTPLGVEGAIIGTALYIGELNLPEALSVARGQSQPGA
jgi:phosphoribosylanthranilate isomerase